MMTSLGISAFIIFCFFCLSWRMSKSAVTSFYFSAIFSHWTALGDINISTALILLATMLLFACGRTRFNLGRVVAFSLFAFCILGGAAASTVNSPGLGAALGRFGKMALVFLPLFFPVRAEAVEIGAMVKAFVICTLVFSIPCLLFFGADPGFMGTPRISGFFEDANYFALISLICLIYASQYMQNKSWSWLLLAQLICSQAMTMLAITLVYFLILRRREVSKKMLAIFPVIIGLGYVYIIYRVQQTDAIVLESDYQTSFVAMKFNSVFFRFFAQFSAMDIIQNRPSVFWFGYGSGHSVELFGRVLHNTYVQLFFDSGIVVFLGVLLVVGLGSFRFDRQKPVFIILIISSLLFDAFFMFIFPFALVIATSNPEHADL
ncbi:hypothetical protein [Amantichitinum ursilacus]|uniref:O-Antigen ligase n=1 Tax=Amantichitinum ursilacus TaxID=857265 RepID=A0A0N1JSI5_9NEIS|nr:hypothetical protein [Amantichitinum ursilacus]KPC52205.1 hypothetical protein WG78_14135 [Amantichitinum ursilacus]